MKRINKKIIYLTVILLINFCFIAKFDAETITFSDLRYAFLNSNYIENFDDNELRTIYEGYSSLTLSKVENELHFKITGYGKDDLIIAKYNFDGEYITYEALDYDKDNDKGITTGIIGIIEAVANKIAGNNKVDFDYINNDKDIVYDDFVIKYGTKEIDGQNVRYIKEFKISLDVDKIKNVFSQVICNFDINKIKSTYEVGEQLDYSQFKVTANYCDGNKKELDQNEYTLSKTLFDKSGNENIILNYNNSTKSFNMTIYDVCTYKENQITPKAVYEELNKGMSYMETLTFYESPRAIRYCDFGWCGYIYYGCDYMEYTRDTGYGIVGGVYNVVQDIATTDVINAIYKLNGFGKKNIELLDLINMKDNINSWEEDGLIIEVQEDNSMLDTYISRFKVSLDSKYVYKWEGLEYPGDKTKEDVEEEIVDPVVEEAEIEEEVEPVVEQIENDNDNPNTGITSYVVIPSIILVVSSGVVLY